MTLGLRQTDAWGIDTRYRDGFGDWHDTPEETRRAVMAAMALSAVTTHDLPTIAGLWTGSDLEAQTRIGLLPNVEGTQESRDRLKMMAGLTERSAVDEVVQKAHELLATAPSRVITASLDDVLGVEERPNMPATTNEKWPNWSMALPKTIEEIETDARVSAVAAVLSRRE